MPNTNPGLYENPGFVDNGDGNDRHEYIHINENGIPHNGPQQYDNPIVPGGTSTDGATNIYSDIIENDTPHYANSNTNGSTHEYDYVDNIIHHIGTCESKGTDSTDATGNPIRHNPSTSHDDSGAGTSEKVKNDNERQRKLASGSKIIERDIIGIALKANNRASEA